MRSSGHRSRGRVIPTVDARIRLGEEAAAAHDTDRRRGWLMRFVEQKWQCPRSDPACEMLRMRVKRSLTLREQAQTGNPRGCPGRGQRPVGVRSDRARI